MQCDQFHGLLTAYLDESLDPAGRAELRDHLASCPGCRAAAFEREPTLMFALAERRSPAPERIAQSVASVMAQVRQERLAHELPRRRPAWWLAAAAALMVAAAGVMWRSSLSAPAAVASPAVRPAVAGVVSTEDVPPRVEIDMPDDDVRVYHQYADDSSGDAAVYFVVNPRLES